jgi:hypothetical protein
MSNRNPASVLGMLQGNKNAAQLEQIANKQWNEFCQNGAVAPWAISSFSGGTGTAASGSAKHPGCIVYGSSSTINSGVGTRLNPSSILLVGGESTTIVFKTATTLNGVIRRMGFHDTVDHNPPTDGVYVEIINGVLEGETTNNGTRTATNTTYTLTADTWYRLKIELNSDATLATYTLFADDSSTILWTNSLSSNIPKTAGRETSQCDICSYGVASAITIGLLDYMDIIIPKARKV